MIDYATDWREAGACRSADPELFFPVPVGTAARAQVITALRICGRCPVREECLEFAMRTGETHGIWGGKTPDERIRAWRARNRRADAARAS
jgi:WhiB family redox-sensing transcriptional regulator